MDTSLICTFAVGFPDGLRSSSFGVTLGEDRSEIRLSARTRVSRSEIVIRTSPDSAASAGASAELARPEVRQAVFDGTWLGDGSLAAAWPGQAVAPGTQRLLSLYLSGSALRKFEAPPGEPEPRWIAPPKGLGQVVVSFLVATGDRRPEAVEGAGEELGQGALADGRRVWVHARREECISSFQKAGFFTALRKRPAPEISQAAAWRDGTRVLFACELGGAGFVVEQPGDLFRTRANY